jgi:hypothetical protein
MLKRLALLVPTFFLSAASLMLSPVPVRAQQLPALLHKDGRFSFQVDGKPYLILGVQINNSSTWTSMLPKVWSLVDTLPINTVEAPVYWEQIEPHPGQFDFTHVDALITQARTHKVRLILCWFGTWKNGTMQYTPEWVKTDTKTYPRMINEAGQPIGVLSANSTTNLHADISAYVAFMRHLKEIDGDQHTVIMMQVENEPGSIGAVRDHSPKAEADFNTGVPAVLAHALGKKAGSWREVFGGEADEAFQAYSVAHYIDQVSSAGKQVMALPTYVNVWQRYPFAERYPGVDYPSGGATNNMLKLWEATAHSIDAYAPDTYSEDPGMQNKIIENYGGADNPVWICESGNTEAYAPLLYRALGRGTIGVSSFGVDLTNWNVQTSDRMNWLRENLSAILPMQEPLAAWLAAGHVQTSVETPDATRQVLSFGKWEAVINYGSYKPDHRTEQPSGTEKHDGRALVAQIGPDEFIITGINANVLFQLAEKEQGHAQILHVEEGAYEADKWTPIRLWNGDQTDHGMHFRHSPVVLQVKMGVY